MYFKVEFTFDIDVNLDENHIAEEIIISMIFKGLSVQELSLADFENLIRDRTPEGPNLEYKESAYNREGENLREMLKDVIALANSGGGYLIMGIREDAFGRADAIVPIIGITQRAQSIRQACLDGISERIEGLEIGIFESSPDQGIIAAHVPNNGRRPHMVSRDHHTDFIKRYDTDKRVMTIGEIRDLFFEKPDFRQETEIRSLLRKSESATYLKILTDRSVERFLERFMITTGQQILVIISPYIGDLVGESFSLADVIKKIQSENARLFVITREPQDDYHRNGLTILNKGENVEIRYNSNIHAKLYISWNRSEEKSFALFGSGNLTTSGISYNLELGMMLLSRGYGRTLVRELYNWGTNLRTRSMIFKSFGKILD